MAVDLTGTYFSAMEAKIAAKFDETDVFPRSAAAFRSMLRQYGIAFDSLRDPWGRPYEVAFRQSISPMEQVTLYDYSEYNGMPERRAEKTMKSVKLSVLEVRSVGEDGR